MSLNDKVKVLWKANCQWQNRLHWPKRKAIKLRDGETEVDLLPLKLGDMVKIKFGTRWYDAEVAENWKPKIKKGGCTCNCAQNYFVTLNLKTMFY